MENTTVEKVELSSFIKNFFDELKSSKDYRSLVDQPFSDKNERDNLYSYLNMDVIGKNLIILKQGDKAFVNTFMSNGLEWVNATVMRNEKEVVNGNPRELAHLYVNILALLACAPTVFMKIGALTMFSTAPSVVKTWVKD